MSKNSVQIQIAKQLPITLGSKILIDDHSVAIHEAIMCGGVTTIRGYLGNKNQMNIDNLETQTPEEKEALDLIDTTPHQYEMSKFSGNEWNGEGLPPVGAICNWRMASGEVEICGRYGNMTWIFDIEMGAHVSVKDADGFTKIETPQQREERERLEAAYDLYCVWVGDRSGYHAIDFDKWKVEPDFLNKWLRIVDKTNYRKESN